MQDALEIDNDELSRAATTLTGGIGGQGCACGSLIGSEMILGTVCGIDKSTVKDAQRMGNAIGRAGGFYQQFVKEYGSPICRDIVTGFGNGVFYDMGIPEEAARATELGVVEKCSKLVEDTCARLVEEVWDDLHGKK